MRPFWYRARAYRDHRTGTERVVIRPGILGSVQTDVALGAARGWFNAETLKGIQESAPEWVLAGGE